MSQNSWKQALLLLQFGILKSSRDIDTTGTSIWNTSLLVTYKNTQHTNTDSIVATKPTCVFIQNQRSNKQTTRLKITHDSNAIADYMPPPLCFNSNLITQWQILRNSAEISSWYYFNESCRSQAITALTLLFTCVSALNQYFLVQFRGCFIPLLSFSLSLSTGILIAVLIPQNHKKTQEQRNTDQQIERHHLKLLSGDNRKQHRFCVLLW